jgi:transposase
MLFRLRPLSASSASTIFPERGQRYGTIVCDLERRRVVDVVPDREAGRVEAWLSPHPDVTIIVRDRAPVMAQPLPGLRGGPHRSPIAGI